MPANTMLRFSFAIFNVFRWIFIGCSAHQDSSSRTLHPLRGSKNVWDNEHDPEGGAPAADPGHAGEVGLGTPRCSSMSWQEVRLPPRDVSSVHEYPP